MTIRKPDRQIWRMFNVLDEYTCNIFYNILIAFKVPPNHLHLINLDLIIIFLTHSSFSQASDLNSYDKYVSRSKICFLWHWLLEVTENLNKFREPSGVEMRVLIIFLTTLVALFSYLVYYHWEKLKLHFQIKLFINEKNCNV